MIDKFESLLEQLDQVAWNVLSAPRDVINSLGSRLGFASERLSIAGFLAIASFVGVIWTALFCITAPSGTVDASTAALLPLLVAAVAFFVMGSIASSLVVSGFITLGLNSPDRSKKLTWEIALFYFIIFAIFLSVTLFYALPVRTVWFIYFIGIAGGILPGAVSSGRKRGQWPTVEYLGRMLVAAVGWLSVYITLYWIALTIARTFPYKPAIVAYLAALLFLAVFMNLALSFGHYALAGISLAMILLAFAMIGSNVFFRLPYAMLGFTGYSVGIALPADTATIVKTNCLPNLRSDPTHPDTYEINVLSSLGDYYVVECASRNTWLAIPRHEGGRLIFSPMPTGS